MKFPVHQVAKVTYPVQQLINSTVSTIATLLGWQIDPVADIAALATVEDARIADGSGKFVRTVMDTFHLDKDSTALVDGITVVATMSGNGRWIRSMSEDTVWVNQLDWYIDAVAGNDESTGMVGNPIKTWAEFQRRTRNQTVAYNVYILSDMPATDIVIMDNAYMQVQGVPKAVSTGTLTGATPTANATNTQATITDNTVAVWTPGTLVRIPAKNAYFWIAKDNGGGQARITTPSEVLPNAWMYTPSVIPVLQPGDVYEIMQLPNLTPRFLDLRRIRLLDFDGYGTFHVYQTDCILCKMNYVEVMSFGRLMNCCLAQGGTLRSVGVSNTLVIGSSLSLNGGVALYNTLVQGRTVYCNPGNGVIQCMGLGIFDATIGMEIHNVQVRVVSSGAAYSGLYGSTTGTAVLVYRGGRLQCSSITTRIYINGTPQLRIGLNDVGHEDAMPTLRASAGAVIPVLASCNTWAKVIAAPFNGSAWDPDTDAWVTRDV